MKILGVVITDGVGFRNFILSDFIKEAEEKFETIVILSCLPKTAYENLNINCKIIELDVFEENFITWVFRKTKEVAHLQLFAKDFFGINDNFEAAKIKNKSNRGIVTNLIIKWTSIFKSEKWIQCYDLLQQKSFSNNKITKDYLVLLKDEKITSLFFTHQRPPFIAPLIYASKKLKIISTTFIFSWDNLASKGRMAGNFDKYLVWSDLMKSELLYFYKKIQPNAVNVVGAPQFEPYILDRYKVEKDDFFAEFELDSAKPTICYSCGDISTSKNDTLYIETIANAIINKKLVMDVNLFVRTSPAEEPTRLMYLAKNYPFIKWNYPKWFQTRADHQEAWSQRIPTVQDVKDLRSILTYSDLSINICSTMSLDFMLFDKPVINPVFGNANNGLLNDQRFLKFAHYEKVVQSGAVAIAKNEIELIDSINFSLQNPNQRLQSQKDILAIQIGKPLEDTSRRIAEALLAIDNR